MSCRVVRVEGQIVQSLLNCMALCLDYTVENCSYCTEEDCGERPSQNQSYQLLLPREIDILPDDFFGLRGLLELYLLCFLS
jgi:hypothetical protein